MIDYTKILLFYLESYNKKQLFYMIDSKKILLFYLKSYKWNLSLN